MSPPPPFGPWPGGGGGAAATVVTEIIRRCHCTMPPSTSFSQISGEANLAILSSTGAPVAQMLSEPGRPGIWRLGSTTNDRISAVDVNNMDSTTFGAATLFLHTRWRIPQLSNATNTFIAKNGWSANSQPAVAANGVFIDINTTTGELRYNTTDGTGTQQTLSGVVIPTNTWLDAWYRVDPSLIASFAVQGPGFTGAIVTHSTHVPATAVGIMALGYSRSATVAAAQRTIDLDFVEAWMEYPL